MIGQNIGYVWISVFDQKQEQQLGGNRVELVTYTVSPISQLSFLGARSVSLAFSMPI